MSAKYFRRSKASSSRSVGFAGLLVSTARRARVEASCSISTTPSYGRVVATSRVSYSATKRARAWFNGTATLRASSRRRTSSRAPSPTMATTSAVVSVCAP